MATVASPLRLFYDWTYSAGDDEALSWHPPAPLPPVRWNYRRLWWAAVEASNKLLTTCGAVPSNGSQGPAVAVAVEEGPELVVSFLAIALAGCTIVPISPTEPPARIASILEDAQCEVVIVDSRRSRASTRNIEQAARHAKLSQNVTLLEAGDLVTLAEEDDELQNSYANRDISKSTLGLQLDITNKNNFISHIFFTSGSTGRPKGCVSSREALAWYCAGKNEAHGIYKKSVVFIASPHTFDPCLGDVFATLASGACIAIAPKHETFEKLGQCLIASKATHLLTTPSMLESVDILSYNDNGNKSLQVIALGGEPMSVELAKKWAQNIDMLANTYGVTECCVYQGFYKIDEKNISESSVRCIGKPIGNGCLFLVSNVEDTLGVDLIDMDELLTQKNSLLTQESNLFALWIAGPQVGLGYALDSTKLDGTNFRTVVDAFGKECRVYRTRDLVRHVQGGFEFAGRQDRVQVKLNGARVDLREIELAVLGSGIVTECVCEVVKSTSTNAADVLTTHVVLAQNELMNETTRVALELFTSCFLPPGFVPKRFKQWETFPTTSSCKVDVSRLSAGKESDLSCEHTDDLSEPNVLTPTELLIATAWSESLGLLTPNGIHARDDFFALGGNSMSALRATRNLEKTLSVRSEERFKALSSTDTESTIGLKLGEAAAFFRDEEDRACAFDALDGFGFLSPLELLKRPVLCEYAAFLEKESEGLFEDNTKSTEQVQERPVDRPTTALVTACAAGRVRVVQCLLSGGVDPNSTARDGFTPVHVAAAICEKTTVDIIKALLAHGADPRATTNAGTTAGHLAAARGDHESLRTLILHGCPWDLVDGDKQSIVHLAARSGDYLATETAALACGPLRNATAGLEAWDAWKRTASDWASLNNKGDALLALRDSGARMSSLSAKLARSSVTPQVKNISDKKTTKASSVLGTLIEELRTYGTGETSKSLLQAVTTLKELVCANGKNRDDAVRLGAIEPLVRLIQDTLVLLEAHSDTKADSNSVKSIRLQTSVASCGALRNLAYANPANRSAVRNAGAVEVLEEVLRIIESSSSPVDGVKKQLAFVANSALVNLLRKEREEGDMG